MNGMALSPAALDTLKGLALRAHDGAVYIDELCEPDGLRWVRVSVLLTDMGDVPPIHEFRMSPTGVLRKVGP